MKNQNILCCINDAPLFSYSPILNKNFSKLDQIIINYVTEKTNCKRWIKKEKAKEGNVEFFYYEINLEKAYKYALKKKKYKYNSVENFCLSFLNYFLEDTPNNLLYFLKSTNSFTKEELEEIKLDFECKINTPNKLDKLKKSRL